MPPNDDPYVYPGTDVLKNKADLRDAEALKTYERVASREYRDTNPPGGARDQLIEAIDKLLGEAQTPLDDDATEHSLS